MVSCCGYTDFEGNSHPPNHSGTVCSGVRSICSSNETGAEAKPIEMEGYFLDLVAMLRVQSRVSTCATSTADTSRTCRPSSRGAAAESFSLTFSSNP